MEFSLYLLEKGKTAVESLRVPGDGMIPPGNAGELGELWVFPNDPKTPDWVGLIVANWPNAPLHGILSSRGGVVMAFEVGERIFLAVFGTGHQHVDKENVVRDFGRRTVANCVHPAELRQVSRKAIEGNNLQAIEQTPRSSAISGYGIDIDRDLLKGLAGVPRKKAFGAFLAGSDSLHGKMPKGGLPHLVKIARLYLAAYQQKIIMKDLRWVDRFRRVTAPGLRSALDANLDQALSGKTGMAFPVLGLPELVDLSDNPTFSFEKKTANNATAVFDDPTLTNWLEWLAVHKGVGPTLVEARKRSIYLHAGGADNVRQYSIARCLTWMGRYQSRTYVYHDRDWYVIEEALVKDVSDFVRRLLANRSGITWPTYTGGTEGTYNSRAAATIVSHSLENLDKHNITLKDAKTAIEPCDLFEPRSKHLIFVKRKKKGSEGLSHLLAQVQVGVDAFMSHDGEMRRAIYERIQIKPAVFDPYAQPDPAEWTVVILICGADHRRGLPFLTYMAMRRVVLGLESRFGLKICLEYA